MFVTINKCVCGSLKYQILLVKYRDFKLFFSFIIKIMMYSRFSQKCVTSKKIRNKITVSILITS